MNAWLLGLVLAGSELSLFGNDKAATKLSVETLLSLAISRLECCCARVSAVGRDATCARVLEEWLCAATGSIGGIAAGLRYARKDELTSALSFGVDRVGLPEVLLRRPGTALSYAIGQPATDHWSVAASFTLAQIFESDGSHSAFAFAEASKAREAVLEKVPSKISTSEALTVVETLLDL